MDDFRKLLSASLGEDVAARVLDALEEKPEVSIRLNPSKPATLDFETGNPVPWNEDAFFLTGRPVFTADPLFHGGAYYVQDSSAMFPAKVFMDILPSVAPENGTLRVLDLCAAPGGKTTGVLSVLSKSDIKDYLLVANEISSSRVTVLCENVARWGNPSAVVTSVDPAAFSSLDGYFDVILADVPCSGEGMFRKDAEARAQWSLQNVSLCQGRQRRILSDAWKALRQGGVLIYSTCTFNHLENDDNAGWIAETLGGEMLEIDAPYAETLKTRYGCALVPGFARGEGQYCAAIVKTAPGQYRHKNEKKARGVGETVKNVWLEGDGISIVRRNNLFVGLTAALAKEQEALAPLRPLRSGIAVGELKGKDMVPHADLALAGCLLPDAFARLELDRERALAFLQRETLYTPEAPKGYLLVTYKGVALGFVKNLGTRCNNLLPAGRRIRIEV